MFLSLLNLSIPQEVLILNLFTIFLSYLKNEIILTYTHTWIDYKKNYYLIQQMIIIQITSLVTNKLIQTSNINN